jgi:hypothetical protein
MQGKERERKIDQARQYKGLILHGVTFIQGLTKKFLGCSPLTYGYGGFGTLLVLLVHNFPTLQPSVNKWRNAEISRDLLLVLLLVGGAVFRK